MEDQKRENLLNLALDAGPLERQKSENLEVGYDRQTGVWELIVRHFGTLEALSRQGIEVHYLLGGYAVLKVPEQLMDAVSAMGQIEYIEKPKRLFFAVNAAKAASCLLGLQPSSSKAAGRPVDSLGRGLTGRGVLVAVIDSGIDYFHPDFRNEDGSSRIVSLWDQNLGEIYDNAQINEALQAESREMGLRLVPSVDSSGHGTAVAAIAAGNGRTQGGTYRGVAYESPLLVVKLGNPLADNFPRTTQLMEGLDFVVRRARELAMPVAVNVSFGNTYGSHDGTSLLETYMDDISNYGRSVITVGTGNEGVGFGHTAGKLEMGKTKTAELSVAPFETGMGVQLWKSYADVFSVEVVAPSGQSLGVLKEELGPQSFRYGNTRLLVYYGKPAPYSPFQEVYFDFIPTGAYMDSGIWSFRLKPEKIVRGDFDFWLPSRGSLNPETRFLFAVPDTTLTIPSTASKVISVGAYDDARKAYADFSGRGFTRQTGQAKPDLAAPGVGITAARAGGGYEEVTGTSFAAPFVTGSAALLMQWGIADGNDPFLYGEKVKAYFHRGAKPLPGFSEYPNPQVGYGTLCVRDSLPL